MTSSWVHHHGVRVNSPCKGTTYERALEASMIRPRLLEWQWSDYSAKHRDRINLLLHIVAVPLFQIAPIVLVVAVVTRSRYAAGLGCLGIGAAGVIPGRGHRRGPGRPTPLSRPPRLLKP